NDTATARQSSHRAPAYARFTADTSDALVWATRNADRPLVRPSRSSSTVTSLWMVEGLAAAGAPAPVPPVSPRAIAAIARRRRRPDGRLTGRSGGASDPRTPRRWW